MDKITIIVPVYNAAPFIEKCINSLLEQTHKDIEVLIIDDGSTDNSGAICEEMAKKDNRVVYIRQENQGVSVARNTGLDKARGEWITFVDSDDWVEPAMCERALWAAVESNADVVIWSFFSHYSDRVVESKLVKGTTRDLTDEKDELELKTISQYYGGISKGSPISAGCTWGKLYKRELIESNHIRFTPGLIRAQDTVFSLEAFELAKKIFFLDEKLYHYRRSDSSITSGTKYIENCSTPFNMLLDAYGRFIKKYNKDHAFEEALYLRTIQVLMWHFRHNLFNAHNKESWADKRRKILQLISSEPYRTALKEVNTRFLTRRLKIMVIMLKYRAVALYRLAYRMT
ncbi:MAG TPA: glycosyltransferase [Clostridiales bacterium]|nr:glycosyltransferase [Clostridiales bacterium]